MSDPENDPPDEADETAGFDRRTVLKVTGAAAIGTVAFSTTAAASKSQFFGCSQVCTGSDQDIAIVWTETGYVCRVLDKAQYGSTRGNIPFSPGSNGVYACREAGEDEAIVGVLHGQKFCPNPNRCAENYLPDDYSKIADNIAPNSNCPVNSDYWKNVDWHTCSGCTYQSNGSVGYADPTFNCQTRRTGPPGDDDRGPGDDGGHDDDERKGAEDEDDDERGPPDHAGRGGDSDDDEEEDEDEEEERDSLLPPWLSLG